MYACASVEDLNHSSTPNEIIYIIVIAVCIVVSAVAISWTFISPKVEEEMEESRAGHVNYNSLWNRLLRRLHVVSRNTYEMVPTTFEQQIEFAV